MEGSVSNVEVCNFAYTGQFEKLKQCILSDKTLACKTDQDRRTALHWACSAGHTDIVEFLLDMGVEVNLQDDVSLFVGTLILSFCRLFPIRCHVTINTRDILMNTLFQNDATDVCVLFFALRLRGPLCTLQHLQAEKTS
uniref:Proteasome 26S subunit, non-ATPase 10 n=1 Tax=Pundamilia nyererei TaxID=303518 RepID=A0A3B4H964_9CICH